MLGRQTRTPVIPKNRGAARTARTAIDRLFPTIAEGNDNTLSVNGFPILFYRRLRSGLGCTCCNTTGPTPPNDTIDDIEPGSSGQLPNNETQFPIENGVGTISFDRYGSRHLPKNDDRRKSPPNDQPNLQVTNVSADIDDPYVDELVSTTLSRAGLLDSSSDDALGNFDFGSSVLLGTSTSGCGVCLGTSYVGGYATIGAQRMVLDAQTPWTTLNIVDNQTLPRSLTALGPDGGRLQFEITLPVGVTGIDCLRVWNNKNRVVSGWKLDVWDDVSSWVEASSNILRFCDGKRHTFRLYLSTDVTITHVELQLQVGIRPIYAEWPNLSESQNPALPETWDNVQLQLSPYLLEVRVGDVIAESTYEKVWLITNVVDKRDREKRIGGWEVTARYIQSYEFQWNLHIRRSSHRFNRVQQPSRSLSNQDTYEPYTSGSQTKSR